MAGGGFVVRRVPAEEPRRRSAACSTGWTRRAAGRRLRVAAPAAGHAGRAGRARPGPAARRLPRADQAARGGGAGEAAEVAARFPEPPRGEITLVAGRRGGPARRRSTTPCCASWPTRVGARRAAGIASSLSGHPRNAIYRRLTGLSRMPHCDGVLDHDTDLLRQLRPAPRPRLHDRGRRRAGPPPPPPRRGRLLPDRHRRARRQRRPGRRGRGDAAEGVLRHGVGAVPRAGRGSSRPTTSSSAPPTPSTSAGCRTSCSC